MGSPSVTAAVLLAADSKTRLRFVPTLNFNGSLALAITFQAWDQTTGPNGGVGDASQSGGTSAFSIASQTASIQVLPNNSAPSFTGGSNQLVLEEAPAQSIANWATAMSPGASDEIGQVLDFIVSNNNNSLFSVQPAITSDGTLTYTPAADANGIATVTVKLHDDGGTANGGVDISIGQTFTITVTAVNDAPSFVAGTDETVLEDSGAKTFTSWATSISAGPANESTQSLNFIVSNDNNSLFSSQPALSASGTLTFTPAANANGSATVTVQLHDNAGTSNGGIDTSPAQTFTINVTALNDVPKFTKGSNQTVLEDAGAQSVSGWATAISAGPADESGQALNFIVSNNNNSLFSTQPAISSNGTLTYTPAANANGSATVTVQIHDDGGTANGGVDTSAAQTFTITVTAVNDAPVLRRVRIQTSSKMQARKASWAGRLPFQGGAANESGQTLNFIVTQQQQQPVFDATGDLVRRAH